jgi:hypothetical protein
MQPGYGYRALMIAVIDSAIDDLKKRNRDKETDRAMAFILSDICEAFCLELEIDYRTLREKAENLYQQFLEKHTT